LFVTIDSPILKGVRPPAVFNIILCHAQLSSVRSIFLTSDSPDPSETLVNLNTVFVSVSINF
ncbi:uncharacterized protein METZ01_LOCUS510016, partial [marine metagenome]